jgi:hypothetical protein
MSAPHIGKARAPLQPKVRFTSSERIHFPARSFARNIITSAEPEKAQEANPPLRVKCCSLHLVTAACLAGCIITPQALP